jgi:hypothetical protein
MNCNFVRGRNYWGLSDWFLCNTTTNNQISCLWNEMQQQRDDFSPTRFSFALEYAIWKFQKPGGNRIKRATSASDVCCQWQITGRKPTLF